MKARMPKSWHDLPQSDAEQGEWLNAKMTEIFGEGGYPYYYIDKLEDMGQ